ncbi:MAG: hypothetical protein ABGX17_02770 [Desulfurobacteriaceae bacterium]
MGKLLQLSCILLYLVSTVGAILVVSKVIEVRSKCTEEKKKISSLVSEIRDLKDENTRLMVEYYSKVRPELVDKNSSKLKDFNEDEVEYIR